MTIDKKEPALEAETIHIIEQSKDSYENGLAHGTALKKEITDRISIWEQTMGEALGLTRDSIHAIIFEHTSFLMAIEKKAPQLLEEIYGIADGASIERNRVLFYNLGEEIYSFCNADFETCSNIAYQGTATNAVSYNQDLPNFLQGTRSPVLLKHKDHIVFTMPGSIALSGVSKHIAVSCNSLPMLKMNKEGLPLVFVVRKLLRQTNIKNAIAYLNDTPLAIPQNLMLVSEEDAVTLELSKNGFKTIFPDSAGFIMHTNFPVANKDLKRSALKKFSCERFGHFDSLTVAIANFEEQDILETLREAHHKEPILNQETFLQYHSVFHKKGTATTLFTNPRTKETITLTF